MAGRTVEIQAMTSAHPSDGQPQDGPVMTPLGPDLSIEVPILTLPTPEQFLVIADILRGQRVPTEVDLGPIHDFFTRAADPSDPTGQPARQWIAQAWNCLAWLAAKKTGEVAGARDPGSGLEPTRYPGWLKTKALRVHRDAAKTAGKITSSGNLVWGTAIRVTADLCQMLGHLDLPPTHLAMTAREIGADERGAWLWYIVVNANQDPTLLRIPGHLSVFWKYCQRTAKPPKGGVLSLTSHPVHISYPKDLIAV